MIWWKSSTECWLHFHHKFIFVASQMSPAIRVHFFFRFCWRDNFIWQHTPWAAGWRRRNTWNLRIDFSLPCLYLKLNASPGIFKSRQELNANKLKIKSFLMNQVAIGKRQGENSNQKRKLLIERHGGENIFPQVTNRQSLHLPNECSYRTFECEFLIKSKCWRTLIMNLS